MEVFFLFEDINTVEIIHEQRIPDNTFTTKINDTTYIIDEFFEGKETINDIIVKRIKRELSPLIPISEKG